MTLREKYRLRTNVAEQVIRACATGPQNPYRYFIHKGRRYGYAVFAGLVEKGALEKCQPPDGGRGYHWFTATADARRLLEV